MSKKTKRFPPVQWAEVYSDGTVITYLTRREAKAWCSDGNYVVRVRITEIPSARKARKG